MAEIGNFMNARRATRRAVWTFAPESALQLDRDEPTGRWRGLSPRAARPAATNPLFFNVRSFAYGEGTHTLQLGFVDADANVVFSAFTTWPSEGAVASPAGEPQLSVEPLDPESTSRMLQSICRGAELIGFHRVLQGGLLPQSAVSAAASLGCVWRGVQAAAMAQGLRWNSERPITLNDALQLAGMEPVDSDDAVICALAVRELWLWLDRLG